MKTSFFSNDYKKYILLFPVCILIGSVLINIAGMDRINEWQLFNTELDVDKNYSFRYILKYVFAERSGQFIILFLICFSTIKDKLFLGVVGWLGVVFGMIQSALFMQYEFKGVLFFIVCICIHCAIYFIGTVGLLVISEKEEGKLMGIGAGIVALVYLLGVLVESIMSWVIFPHFFAGL